MVRRGEVVSYDTDENGKGGILLPAIRACRPPCRVTPSAAGAALPSRGRSSSKPASQPARERILDLASPAWDSPWLGDTPRDIAQGRVQTRRGPTKDRPALKPRLQPVCAGCGGAEDAEAGRGGEGFDEGGV